MKEVMSGIWETEQDAITQPVMRSPNRSAISRRGGS